MSKKLAGKRWFEALGRSESSRGLPLNHRRHERSTLPIWARSAIARGWLFQPSSRQLTKLIVDDFEAAAKTKGRSLRAEVKSFLETPHD